MAQKSELTEYTSHPPESSSPDNALFLERLDTLMQKSFNEIRAFAERESRSYDETKRRVAEWHAKELFSVECAELTQAPIPEDKSTRVRNILIETSKVLESLSAITGVQSFILAVDPHDPQDAGFLGGSVIGREFFRGIRGGGSAGASSFKAYAQKRLPGPTEEIVTRSISTHSSPVPPVTRSGRQAKVELYESIRSQLRKVSGIRKAEMKWTNPERLSLYGVRLIGWPSDIPPANPSSLKSNQNQKLLELVENGELRFEKTMMTGQEASLLSDAVPQADTTAEDFSWAYDVDGGSGGDALLGHATGAASAAKTVAMRISSVSQEPINDPLLSATTDIVHDEEDTSLGSEFAWKEDDNILAVQHNGMPLFDDEYEFDVNPWNGTAKLEDLGEDNSPIERRARKRARSSDSR